MLITENFEDSFWEEAYRYARKYAGEESVCLEWFGKELAMNCSKGDLLRAAIASGVDGIILEGDPGEDTREIIKEAEEKGQNIILNGIRETLANEGNPLELEMDAMALKAGTGFFWGSDGMKALLNSGELPDIIICLDEKNTVNLCQAVVEYNCVGKVDILGYSHADYALNAVSREALQSALSVNARQLGICCIQVLNEYLETGYVSDFLTVDVDAVTLRNVERYLTDAQEKET